MAESISFEEAKRKIYLQNNPIKIIQKSKDKTGEPIVIVKKGRKEIRTTESALSDKI